MSYPNQELTEHDMYHKEINKNCEYCHELTTNPFSDWLMKFKAEMREKRYQNELRKCWLQMIENYPEIYSIDDYVQACYKARIPII